LERTTLTYSAGNEHDPGNPFGRTELTIAPDGTARLELHEVGRQRAWTGRVAPETLDRVRAALDRAGFPAVSPHPVPGGATIRQLAIGDGADRRAASVEWNAANRLAGYDEAFGVLDAVVRALSGDAVPLGPTPEAGLVTDVRPA
jgi:hypothetical protein